MDGIRWDGFVGAALLENDAVRLSQLVRERRLVWWNEFVAGGEDGDARLAGDGELGNSDGGGETEVGGVEDGSGVREVGCLRDCPRLGGG